MLLLVGVEVVVKRKETLSGASIANKPPLQTPPAFYGDVQQWRPGDGQGWLSTPHPSATNSIVCVWGAGQKSVAALARQGQESSPSRASQPAAGFPQPSQGVEEAPGAPDTMELRRKAKEFSA